jgi:hypothetical protein
MILSGGFFHPLYYDCSKSESSIKEKTMNLTELTGNAEKALRNIFEKIGSSPI